MEPLAATLTAAPGAGYSAQIIGALVTAIVALIGGMALLVPTLVATARIKLEAERVRAQNELDAEKKKSAVIIDSVDAGLKVLPPAQRDSVRAAMKTTTLLAAGIEGAAEIDETVKKRRTEERPALDADKLP